MKYIVYKSDASISEINLLELLESSRKNNKKVSITGILITHGEGFIQYIEGNEQNIDRLFHEKISQDPRHENISIMIQGSISERNFANWDMGYLCLNDRTALSQIIDKGNGFDLVSFYEFVDKSLPLIE